MIRKITRLGKPILLDETKCSEFGFKYGQRINHPTRGTGTVIGVAPRMASFGGLGKDTLWCSFDKSKHPECVLAI